MSTAELIERLEQVTLTNGYCAAEVAFAQAKLARIRSGAERSHRDTQRGAQAAASAARWAARQAAERMARREAREAAARQKTAQDAEATKQKAATEAEPEISDDAKRAARQKALLGFVILLAGYAVRLICLPIVSLLTWVDTGHLRQKPKERHR